MFKSTKIKKYKGFNAKRSSVYNRYKIPISNDLVNDILKISRIKYSKSFVRDIIAIYFSLMAQKLKESNVNISFDMKTLGYLKLEIKPRVCKLTFPPTINMDCKKVNFKFKVIFKRLCWKMLNKNKIDDVVEYIQKKKRARCAVIRHTKYRLSDK